MICRQFICLCALHIRYHFIQFPPKNSYLLAYCTNFSFVKFTTALLVSLCEWRISQLVAYCIHSFTVNTSQHLLTEAHWNKKNLSNSLRNFHKMIFNYHIPVNHWFNLFRPQLLQIVFAWAGTKMFLNIRVNKVFSFLSLGANWVFWLVV